MKKCGKCKIKQRKIFFYSNKSRKDQLGQYCKLCVKKWAEELSDFKKKKYRLRNIAYQSGYRRLKSVELLLKKKLAYRKTPWAGVYSRAKQRCENIKNPRYRYYGGKGIKILCSVQDIKTIWFRDRAFLLATPSIDRINNAGHYEFKNIRFIEKSENTAKRNREYKKLC